MGGGNVAKGAKLAPPTYCVLKEVRVYQVGKSADRRRIIHRFVGPIRSPRSHSGTTKWGHNYRARPIELCYRRRVFYSYFWTLLRGISVTQFFRVDT